MSIKKEYIERRKKYLCAIADDIEIHVKDNIKNLHRIDRVSTRAKKVNSFIEKATKNIDGILKYNDPLNQIQDQIGVRIVTFYLNDVEEVAKVIEGYYRKIESKDIVPDSDSEFGYFGKHFIFLIPDDVINDEYDNSMIPKVFELQVKTLFQHAWGEAEHDLGYKNNTEQCSDVKRKIAFTAAQSWGADQIFSDLHQATKN